MNLPSPVSQLPPPGKSLPVLDRHKIYVSASNPPGELCVLYPSSDRGTPWIVMGFAETVTTLPLPDDETALSWLASQNTLLRTVIVADASAFYDTVRVITQGYAADRN